LLNFDCSLLNETPLIMDDGQQIFIQQSKINNQQSLSTPV